MVVISFIPFEDSIWNHNKHRLGVYVLLNLPVCMRMHVCLHNTMSTNAYLCCLLYIGMHVHMQYTHVSM